METYSTSCKLWNLSRLQKMEMFLLKGKYLTCSAALELMYNSDCSPSLIKTVITGRDGSK